MRCRIACAALLAATAGSPAFAATGQGLGVTALSYIISVPTAGTADFVDNSVSFRGLGIEWNSPMGSDLYWGLSLRWLYFRDIVERGTFTVGNATATGRLYRSVDSIPIAFHLKYPFASDTSRFIPFLGFGAGATYATRQLEIGTLSNNEFGWQALVIPEAGAVFRWSSTSSSLGYFNVRYDAGLGSDAVEAISNLSFALGIASTF